MNTKKVGRFHVHLDRKKGTAVIMWQSSDGNFTYQNILSLTEFKMLCSVLKSKMSQQSLKRQVEMNKYLHDEKRKHGHSVVFFFSSIYIDKNGVEVLCSFQPKSELDRQTLSINKKFGVGPRLSIVHVQKSFYFHSIAIGPLLFRQFRSACLAVS